MSMVDAVKARVAEAGCDQAAVRHVLVAMVTEEYEYVAHINTHENKLDEMSELEALFNSTTRDPFERLCDDIWPTPHEGESDKTMNMHPYTHSRTQK